MGEVLETTSNVGKPCDHEVMGEVLETTSNVGKDCIHKTQCDQTLP
jgi:hypothetical protein